ncbi:MAG TPA: hypothetical protein VFQ42_22475 [Mycobacterium sp.]|nr:hypothetical protein [Mycobacterium sp.]
MASFEQVKQAIGDGGGVIVSHREVLVALGGGGYRTRKAVVATWTRAVLIENYAAPLPGVQQTDELTPDQVEELIRLGARDERDPS